MHFVTRYTVCCKMIRPEQNVTIYVELLHLNIKDYLFQTIKLV